MVERVEDELVAAWLGVAESMVRESVERETCCRKRKKKNWGGGWFFCQLWTRFSPPSGHQLRLYL